jgi:hypothetical protein
LNYELLAREPHWVVWIAVDDIIRLAGLIAKSWHKFDTIFLFDKGDWVQIIILPTLARNIIKFG